MWHTVAPSGADAAAHGDILQCRCSGTRLTEACQRNSGTRSFCMGKEALPSHGQRIASESPVIFSNKLSQARALFSLRLRIRTLRHTDACQGGALIQGTHRWYTILAQMLWHTVPDGGADAMAHDPRWWRRWRDRKRRGGERETERQRVVERRRRSRT